jgi:EmrB/QacA subfamily drug resistance transporter
VLVTAAVLSLLDATLLGMAIPSLRAAFGATAAEARWATTIHLVAMGMAVPVAGGLGDRLGAARLLRWSLAAFTAASLLGGLAWNLDLLLALRAVQGAAAGLVLPVSVALLCRIRPGRAWATALVGGGLLLAPAAVPALGAWLAGQLEWRVLLLVNLPLGMAALLGARLWLPGAAGERGHRVDLAGMATAALAAGSLLLALLQGAAWGWTSAPVLGLLCVCLLSLALLAVVELSVPEPLIDLRALRPSAAALPPLLLAVVAVVLAAGFVEVPLLLQGAGHIGALEAGVTLLLPTALAAAAMATSVWLSGRAGMRWPVASGLLLVALGTYLLHGVPPSEAGRLVLWACLRGAGLGLALAPLTAAIPAATQRVRGAAAVATVCLLLPAAAGLALVSSALAVPAWSPGSQGAAATVQERVILLHGDVALPLAGPTFLHTVLCIAALAALGALAALRLPTGGGRTAG